MSPRTLITAREGGAASPPPPPAAGELDRREALAWMTGGAALLMASCSQPSEKIVPAVETAPGETPGIARRYATTVPLGGYGRGVMGITHEGRPTKLEGSPRHPASLGATDVFAEAEVLGLYDPDRLASAEGPQGPSDWTGFAAALAPRLALARSKAGAGLTVVTGRITSPTELRLLDELRAALPQMAWRRFEPVNEDAAGASAFRPRLDQARVVVCLDADPLGPGPEQIASGRGFVAARDPAAARAGRPMLRLYAVEPGWSLTGMNADHRLALRPELIAAVARRIAAHAGGAAPAADALPPEAARFADAAAADLAAAGGAGLLLAGRSQPPEVHALARQVSERLGASALAPAVAVDPHTDTHAASLQALADDLRAGRVETLFVIGANPVYDAPGALGLEALVRRAPFSAAAALAPSETLEAAQWRLPLSHPLESWGDLRAPSGEASLVQPLVRPLHDSRTGAELLAMLGGAPAPQGYDLVRATWSKGGAGGDAFEQTWRQALTDGVIGGAAPSPGPAPSPTTSPSPVTPAPAGAEAPHGFVLTLAPDPTVYDGRYAANAWLQECPKPRSHEVWGAALAVSPQDAASLRVKDGDHLELEANGGRVVAAVRVTPGQAVGAVSGFIGGGRRRAGPVGTGVGVDFAPLRSLVSPWTIPVSLRPARGDGAPPFYSSVAKLDGEARKLSPVVQAGGPTLGKEAFEHPLRPPSNYPENPAHEPSWAMVIDAAACIGCNSCVVACQAENNVPVVGPHETARGRDMHWLRIDAYDVGEADETRIAFQPVPCMQCEHAPCEPVCPVEASVHDHEGLNAQVYNRCIGTRFCESNCPYKVRRFNFYGYSHAQAYANLGDDSYDAQKNPDVTVRARGVMEKCTYCVQRISAARRLAEREERWIGPHEVVTACQSACPTRAIRFGDLLDPQSGIAEQRSDPRHYALLAELGTRPRTTYLARLRNPNPALEAHA